VSHQCLARRKFFRKKKKRTKDLNRCLTKEAGQMMNTNMKKGPISSAMREI
jgi:hypothetical protein